MDQQSGPDSGGRPAGEVEAARVLHAAQGNTRVRRAAQVRDLELLAEWADLHSVDPRTQPGAVPAARGGPRLVQLGGAGTPEVVDLAIGEIAIARDAGWQATANATGDVLDLRHRLREFWTATRQLRCEVWLARKIARMTRSLSQQACAVVDRALVEAIDQGPGRVLDLAEAKIIEADPEAHRERLAQAARRRGVWFPEPAPGDLLDDQFGSPGLRTLVARLHAGEAVDLHDRLDEIADLLAVHGDHHPEDPPTAAQLRADALAMLADPATVLTFLEHCADPDPADHDDSPPPTPTPTRPAPGRGPAVLNLHLTERFLHGYDALVRSEELGPLLLDQIAELVGHRHITVKPVVDLHEGRSVNGYEHPTDVEERTELRTLGSVFPHATGPPKARIDHDHPTPYDEHGPPGQTGDHNDAPLGRREHRAKTHLGYTLEQTGPNTYRWTTPHGLVRTVDGTGTHHAA